VAVLGVVIAALALLFTGHQPVQGPNLVGPAQGTTSAPASPSASPSPSTSSQYQPQRLSVRVTQSEHLVRIPVRVRVRIPVRVPVRDRHAHTISHRPLATLFAEFVTRYAGHLFCK